jgi:hypothetical protein
MEHPPVGINDRFKQSATFELAAFQNLFEAEGARTIATKRGEIVEALQIQPGSFSFYILACLCVGALDVRIAE